MRPIESIAPAEASDFERWLRCGNARENRYADSQKDCGLAANTVRKRISNSKQFFQDAVARALLTGNPFGGLKGTVGSNRQRDFFLTREDTAKVLAACPDSQWRLIVVLCRYAGLRCPSELGELTWDDVDWERARIRVRSPKTAHHEGHGERWIPPVSRGQESYLDDAWAEAEPGTVCAIARCRHKSVNLRTQFQRIISRAGLAPWPKLFQTLRASRATELANEYPAHVAAAWLGHSTVVAAKHYWQVTDADFEKSGTKCGTVSARNGGKRGETSNHRQ